MPYRQPSAANKQAAILLTLLHRNDDMEIMSALTARYPVLYLDITNVSPYNMGVRSIVVGVFLHLPVSVSAFCGSCDALIAFRFKLIFNTSFPWVSTFLASR